MFFSLLLFVHLSACVCVCTRLCVHEESLDPPCVGVCESLRYFISTRLHMIIKPWGAGRGKVGYPPPPTITLLTGLP